MPAKKHVSRKVRIAVIADIARDRKTKTAHRGGAESWRESLGEE
jgi:hypothetical protein